MIKIEPEKARQGRRGWNVLWMLIVGLVLATGVWLAVEYYGEQIESPPSQQIQQ
ncbi:MAG: hypothetical protein KF874_07910 [Rhizobiaceae bacterium]|nr:hypothetical protein [Rhizobiaceae bacterium]